MQLPLLPLLTVSQHIRGVVEVGNVGDAGADGIRHAGALSRGRGWRVC